MIYSQAQRRVLQLLVIWVIATSAHAKLSLGQDRMAHANTVEDFHATFSPSVNPLIDVVLVSKDLKFDYLFLLPRVEISREAIRIKSHVEEGEVRLERKIHLSSEQQEPSLILRKPTSLTVEELSFVVPSGGLEGAFHNVWKVEPGASVLFKDCAFYLEEKALRELWREHFGDLARVGSEGGNDMHARNLTVDGATYVNAFFRENQQQGSATDILRKEVSQNHDVSWLYDVSESTSKQLHIHLRTNITVYACDVSSVRQGMAGPIIAGRPIMFRGYNTGLKFDSKLAFQGFLEINKHPIFFRDLYLDFQSPDMEFAKGIVQCDGWGCHNIEAVIRLNSKGQECMLDVVDSHFAVSQGGDMVKTLHNDIPLLDTVNTTVISNETVMVHSMMSSGKCIKNTMVTSDQQYKVYDTADPPDCNGIGTYPRKKGGMLPLHVVFIVILVVGILGGGLCLLGLIIVSKIGMGITGQRSVDKLRLAVCHSMGSKTPLPDSIVASADPEMGVYAPEIDLDFKMILDQSPLWILEKICDESNYRRDRSVVMGQRIAEGGYGIVFKGTWKGVPVAIKTVLFRDSGYQSENKERSRAVFEAAISSSVAHPNIVQTYAFSFKRLGLSESSRDGANHSDSDGGIRIASSSEKIRWELDDPEAQVDWKLYMVQELCNAGSLRAALKKRVFMNAANQPNMYYLLRLALDIARGMLHLHRHNIIHGDLTSKNILLRKETNQDGGIDLTGKIADFGLSVKMDESQNHVGNRRAGTPFYMAPEIVQKGLLSKKADVFAFGVVMWELHHSQECYEAKLDENGRRTENLAYHSLFPKFPVTCPMPFAMLCVSCVSPNPDDRPDFPIIVQVLKALLLKVKAGDYSSPAAIRKENLDTSTAIGKISGQQIIEIVARQLGIDMLGAVASRSVDAVHLGQTGVSLGLAPFYWPSEVHVSMNQTFLALNATIVSNTDTTQDESKFELASFNYDEGAPSNLSAEPWENQCTMGFSGGSSLGFVDLNDGLQSWGEGASLDTTFEQFLKAEKAGNVGEGPSFRMGLGGDVFPSHRPKLGPQSYGTPSGISYPQMDRVGDNIPENAPQGGGVSNRQEMGVLGFLPIHGSSIVENDAPVGPLDDLLRRQFAKLNAAGDTVIDIPTGFIQSRRSPNRQERSGPESTSSNISSTLVKPGVSGGGQYPVANVSERSTQVDIESMLDIILGRKRNLRVTSTSFFCEGEKSEQEATGPPDENMENTLDFKSAESTRSRQNG